MPVPATMLHDAFGNITHVLTLDKPHQEIRLIASGEVEVKNRKTGVRENVPVREHLQIVHVVLVHVFPFRLAVGPDDDHSARAPIGSEYAMGHGFIGK